MKPKIENKIASKKRICHKRKRSTKGALIKGMSRRLPSEILESGVFAEHLKKMMRRYAGIYALYQKKKLYYVGLTNNLLGRIKWHLKDRHKGKWDSFTIFRIQRVKYLKDIETLLTHIIETPGNKNKGKVPQDADFNYVLHRVLKEHKRAIRGLERAFRR
jgi:predicted GIY-YIG superfamily endonuclease